MTKRIFYLNLPELIIKNKVVQKFATSHQKQKFSNFHSYSQRVDISPAEKLPPDYFKNQFGLTASRVQSDAVKVGFLERNFKRDLKMPTGFV